MTEDNSTTQGRVADAIGKQILLFPAFADARTLEMTPAEVADLATNAYENDQLSQEQDLILEALLYLASWTEEFHLREAMQVLPDDDFAILMALIQEHRDGSRTGGRP